MGRIQRTWMIRRENRNIWVRFSWLIKNFSSLDMRETPSLAIFILLQQVKSYKMEQSAKFQYHEGISIYNFSSVKNISPRPVIVVIQVDNVVCALLCDGFLVRLHVGGAGGVVHPDPFHDGQHPPDATQEVQTGHHRNTQPWKKKVSFFKTLGPKKSGEESFYFELQKE